MIRKSIGIYKITAIFMALLMFAAFAAPSNIKAEEPTSSQKASSGKANESIDTTELQGFMDGLLASQLENYHIPGATVCVVQNGKIIFQKGYGYSNVDKRIPVSAEQTMFRAGSVSKLFVWTAVMQLAEQGKLDLNADVNTYLNKFKIPSSYKEPVTLNSLMTHSAGFEERAIGESVGSAKDIKPLEEYLAAHMPARVRPPEELTAYSNYGASLAGYIVSQVSGMPFEQYVEENIFKPLNMKKSTFRQPLPENLESAVAEGYSYENGKFKAHEFEWKQSAPAGALSATAADMGNFIIAHLQNGQFETNRILKEATAKEMHEQSFTNDKAVNGIAHGFMVSTINNEHIIWHGGDIFQFHSALVLLPEHNTGFYIAYNGANAMFAVNNTMRAFMDHYYPTEKTAPQAPKDLSDKVSIYAGTYIPARHEYTTLGKLVSLFGSISIKPLGEHEILVSLGFPVQLTARYIEVSQGIFRSVDVPQLIYGDIVFKADSKGKVQYQFQQNNPTTAYIKVPWYAATGFTVTLLAVCVLVFLFFVVWSFVNLIMKLRKNSWKSGMSRKAYLLPGIIGILNIIFLLGFIGVFSRQETVYGLPAWARIIFFIPWIAAALTALMLVVNILGWVRRYWSTAERILYSAGTITALTFVWWTYYWNLWMFKA